jgi:hypothetical protein
MIEQTIENYFMGYQNADSEMIRTAFHQDVKLLSVEEGKLSITEMNDWIKNLDDRKARGDIRKGELKVESTDVTNHSASVKLKIKFSAFEFTDYLSLLQIEGKWKIVGKIYHYSPCVS